MWCYYAVWVVLKLRACGACQAKYPYEWERPSLYPLPSYRYETAKRAEGKVSLYSTVRYDTNNYSVPVKYCGKHVSVKARPESVEIYCEGEMIAVHQRCFRREQSIYRLEHYLPLLERKGRAVFQARPVRDNVPSYFLEWLEKQNLKPKVLVGLLQKSLEFGYDAVMLGQYPEGPAARPVHSFQDEIKVAPVDLTAYDALCGTPKGVSA